jgi:ElaA protein
LDLNWQTKTFDDLSNHALYAVLKLRLDVFSIEQQCIYQDLDNRDQEALHMLGWQGEELVAYQRLLPPGLDYPESSIGRIVINMEARGHNLGKEMVQRGMDFALGTWPGNDIRINAQAYLRKFYMNLGFEPLTEEYIYDGIPHLEMLYRHNG